MIVSKREKVVQGAVAGIIGGPGNPVALRGPLRMVVGRPGIGVGKPGDPGLVVGRTGGSEIN